MGEYLLTEIDEYVTTTPGAPFRLFKFGTVTKGGKKRNITPDYARTFKLPHFKPAIKLGSHDDTTPAGGSIIGLEVRDDGLYAIPELTDKGVRAWVDGDYRYHSPEVIWEGGLENSATGEIIRGPLIVGDALLHTPALGEDAALYSVIEEVSMDETVSVPKGFWDKLMERFDALFAPAPAPEKEPEPVVEAQPDQFAALQAKADEYKAQLDALQAEKDRMVAEQAHRDQLTAIAEELKADKFGGHFAEPTQAAEMLAGMGEEARAWVMQTFAALSAKVDTSALYSEKGSGGEALPDDPIAALDVAIRARMGEKHETYEAAMVGLKTERPDLFSAYKGGK